MNPQKIFLAENVKRLRMRKHWSQEEFAERAGITRSKLSLIEMGKTVNPPVEDLVNFSAIFGVSIDSLIKLDMSKLSELSMRELETGNDSYSAGTKIRVLATTVDKGNNSNVELVPEKAKAGYRSGYGDPEWIAELPRYSLPGLSKHSKYRIFPIKGESMLPYPDGCYIIGEYVEDWLNLKNDTLCVLILKSGNADFVFKQVENKIRKGKKLLAKSLNTEFDPFEVQIEDVLEIWKYKMHITDRITTGEAADIPTARLLRIMQEMKLDLGKLTAQLPG